MAEPGDGGLGHSWFAIDVTSEPVEEGAFPWPEPPVIEITSSPSVPDTGQFVRAGKLVIEDEVRARVRIVRRIEEETPARFQFGQLKPATFTFGQLIESESTASVYFVDEEEEALLLGLW